MDLFINLNKISQTINLVANNIGKTVSVKNYHKFESEKDEQVKRDYTNFLIKEYEES